MPFTASSSSVPEPSTLSAASPRLGANARSPWLRRGMVGALLAIAVQILVMAQLAQRQVERGVQLRQALASEKTEGIAGVRTAARMPLQGMQIGQGGADPLPAHVLH